MKLFDFAIIIALSSAFICQPTDGAEFYFKKDFVKFPDTKEGVILEHEFPFTNIGQEPLLIFFRNDINLKLQAINRFLFCIRN